MSEYDIPLIQIDSKNNDGKETGELRIIPTSHVSKESGELVGYAINEFNPDIVAVELDYPRFQKLIEKMKSEENEAENGNPSLKSVIAKNSGFKQKLIEYFISLLQNRLSTKLGIGLEDKDMSVAVETASNMGIDIALVDRDIQVTLNRLSKETSVRELLKFVGILFLAVAKITLSSDKEIEEQFGNETGSDIETQEIKTVFGEYFPQIKKVLLDERDIYMAKNLYSLLQDGKDILVVMGAAHEPGVKKHLENTTSLMNTEETEQKVPIVKADKST